MPYKIKFERPPVGYAAKAAREDETSASVVFREFLSSEDGMALIQRLEGLPNEVLSKIGDEAGLKSSQIDHMLVHIDREGNGTAYVNELSQKGKVHVRRDVEKGEALYKDDIVDYKELKFEGIDIPVDNGVLVQFFLAPLLTVKIIFIFYS